MRAAHRDAGSRADQRVTRYGVRGEAEDGDLRARRLVGDQRLRGGDPRLRAAGRACCCSCRAATAMLRGTRFCGDRREVRGSTGTPFSVTRTSYGADVRRAASSMNSRCGNVRGRRERRAGQPVAAGGRCRGRGAAPTTRTRSVSARLIACAKRSAGSSMPAAVEVVLERRMQAGGLERCRRSLPFAVVAVDVEHEQVLQRHLVALHPLHLGDPHDLARAVVQAARCGRSGAAPRRPARGSRAPAGRSRPSAPSSRCGRRRRAASCSGRWRASRRGRCSSPGACRAPRGRAPRRPRSGRAACAARFGAGRGSSPALCPRRWPAATRAAASAAGRASARPRPRS